MQKEQNYQLCWYLRRSIDPNSRINLNRRLVSLILMTWTQLLCQTIAYMTLMNMMFRASPNLALLAF